MSDTSNSIPDAVMFPVIMESNAKAIAWHIRQGEPFGGLKPEALAAWVEQVPKDINQLSEQYQAANTAFSAFKNQNDLLRTQLTEAQAACAVKDEALKREIAFHRSRCIVVFSVEHDCLNTSQEALSPTAGQSLLEEVKGLREALESIRDATNADDEKSYRCDDREGCLDWVNGHAQEALKKGGE